jgi:predicted DNA-binding transcriptional regulator AlpA
MTAPPEYLDMLLSTNEGLNRLAISRTTLWKMEKRASFLSPS